MKLGKMFKKPSQNFFGVILALLVVVFIAVLFRYNGAKSVSIDKMTNYRGSPYPQSQGGVDSSMNPVSASTLEGNNYLQVGSSGCAPETNGQKMNPHDLLPKDRNSEWASVNPASQDLTGLSLLSASESIGINTVNSSLRNANLQIRSEPIIPKTNIGPWNNSTIEADLYHRPLEIGQGVL
jgi:hypothetical protein